MEDLGLPTEWSQARIELLRLARHRGTRRQSWSPEMPCDWSPTTVPNPQTGIPFTDESAWNLICELLEREHHFDEVELHKPPGAMAYATTIRLQADLSPVYIKIQLRDGKAWGRSFHIDLRSK
jgi:hypothetical protein